MSAIFQEKLWFKCPTGMKQLMERNGRRLPRAAGTCSRAFVALLYCWAELSTPDCSQANPLWASILLAPNWTSTQTQTRSAQVHQTEKNYTRNYLSFSLLFTDFWSDSYFCFVFTSSCIFFLLTDLCFCFRKIFQEHDFVINSRKVHTVRSQKHEAREKRYLKLLSHIGDPNVSFGQKRFKGEKALAYITEVSWRRWKKQSSVIGM